MSATAWEGYLATWTRFAECLVGPSGEPALQLVTKLPKTAVPNWMGGRYFTAVISDLFEWID